MWLEHSMEGAQDEWAKLQTLSLHSLLPALSLCLIHTMSLSFIYIHQDSLEFMNSSRLQKDLYLWIYWIFIDHPRYSIWRSRRKITLQMLTRVLILIKLFQCTHTCLKKINRYCFSIISLHIIFFSFPEKYRTTLHTFQIIELLGSFLPVK